MLTQKTTTRPFGRYSPSRGALFATALAATLFAASPSYADIGTVTVNAFTPGQIDVNSNGSDYTGPPLPLVSFSAQLQVFLDAEISGKVKSWEAWVTFKQENGILTQFDNYSDQASYNIPRPKTVNTTANIFIPNTTLATVVTNICNFKADSLREQGLSDVEIFAQDRVVPVEVEGALSYEMTGLAGGTPTPEEYVTPQFLDVVCKASPTQEPEANDPVRIVPDVDQASLTILEVSTLNGACKLNLSGVIVTKEANTQVKFRYKDAQGNQSDIKTVMTDAAKTVMFNHQYRLYGGGNKQGSIRIAIEDDNFSSAWSEYDVDCGENAAPGGLVDNDTVRTSGVADGAATGINTEAPNNDAATAAFGKTTTSGTTRPTGPSNEKANLAKPDLMATTLGMSLAGGIHAWGTTVVLNNPASAAVTSVGLNNNLCRFTQTAFRPFNKGTVASGPFLTRVSRGNSQVNATNFNLAAQSGLPANSGWYKFNLDLAQGMNVITVRLDPNKAVAESDEGNNVYTLRVRVMFPCGKAGTTLKNPTRGPKQGGGDWIVIETPLPPAAEQRKNLQLKPKQ